MSDWLPVCRLDDIPLLGARRVARERGIPVALFRTADDKVFALLDRCPHKGGPLSQGIVFGESVACPLHNWSIGLDDGCAKAPDEGCTVRFQVRLDAEGAVSLDRGELASLGLDLPAPVAGPCASTGAAGDRSFDVQAPQAR
jgi:nitrite reductase (NADH) small subunit